MYFALYRSAMIAAHTAANGGAASGAHKVLLFVASELGFVGLALFLGILFFAFKTVLATPQGSTPGAGISLGRIAFTIAGMT